MKTVTMFTTVTCGYCKQAKEFFNKNNIQFQEFDVGIDLAKRLVYTGPDADDSRRNVCP